MQGLHAGGVEGVGGVGGIGAGDDGLITGGHAALEGQVFAGREVDDLAVGPVGDVDADRVAGHPGGGLVVLVGGSGFAHDSLEAHLHETVGRGDFFLAGAGTQGEEEQGSSDDGNLSHTAFLLNSRDHHLPDHPAIRCRCPNLPTAGSSIRVPGPSPGSQVSSTFFSYGSRF